MELMRFNGFQGGGSYFKRCVDRSLANGVPAPANLRCANTQEISVLHLAYAIDLEVSPVRNSPFNAAGIEMRAEFVQLKMPCSSRTK